MGFDQPQGAKWHSGSLGYTQLVNLRAENIEVPRRPWPGVGVVILN